MRNTNGKKIIEPCLCSCDSIVTDVNKEFIKFTGFTRDELVGKLLIEIGTMIRINSQILIDNINSIYSGYIFTKSLSAREVNISLLYGKNANDKIHTFIEKPNSRLDDKLIFEKQTLSDNIVGISIYSVPDLILLKANQKSLDYKDSPFNKEENSIGRPIREIVTGFVGTQPDVAFNTVIETQNSSYIKEMKFDEFARGVTFWDTTLMPIFEFGKMKYIFQTASEVTERVLKNQRLERQNEIIQQQKEQLEEQKEQLEQKNIQLKNQLEKQLEQQNAQLIRIIENLSEGVMVTDNKGKYLMVNPEAKKVIYQRNKLIDLQDEYENTKLFDLEGNKILPENYPAARALRGERVKNAKIFIRQINKEYLVEMSSMPIYNEFGDLSMVISCFHDITETTKQSRKIEEQKRELEGFIENMTDAIVIYNKHGDFTYFNAEARRLYPDINYQNTRKNVHNGFQYYDLDNNIILKENLPTMRAFRGDENKE